VGVRITFPNNVFSFYGLSYSDTSQAEEGYSGAIASLICGEGNIVGAAMVRDPRTELLSFTGSTEVSYANMSLS
jgi:hypothetical protein